MLRSLNLILVVVLGLIVIGCTDNLTDSTGPGNHSGAIVPNDPAVEDVILTDIPPDQFPGYALGLSGGGIDGNRLWLSVSYSGGCLEHTYSCYMSPAAFLESSPVQANLYVRDNTGNDPCDAIIRDTAWFDLSTVASLYLEQYQSLDEIVLNIHDYTDGTPVMRFSLSYTPATE